MPARGSPGASSCCSGWVASQSSRAETSRPSKSFESTSTVPPDSPKPRESHVRTLKPARRRGARPTCPTGASVALFSSLSRTAPHPWVSRIVGALWPGASPCAGKKLALSGAPSKDGITTSRASAAGATTRAAATKAAARTRRTRAFIQDTLAHCGGQCAGSRSIASGCGGRAIGKQLRRHLARVSARHVDDLHAGELAHPGQLAAGEVARAALHRLDVAGQELVEAQRLACGLRGPGRVGGARLADGARGHHGLDAGVDAGVERVALHDEAHEPRRVTGVRRPQLVGAGGRLELPQVVELEQAHDPAAVARR